MPDEHAMRDSRCRFFSHTRHGARLAVATRDSSPYRRSPLLPHSQGARDSRTGRDNGHCCVSSWFGSPIENSSTTNPPRHPDERAALASGVPQTSAETRMDVVNGQGGIPRRALQHRCLACRPMAMLSNQGRANKVRRWKSLQLIP